MKMIVIQNYDNWSVKLSEMTYKEVSADPALRPFVLNHWLFEVPVSYPGKDIAHTVLPDACVFTAYHIHEQEDQKWARICGPRTLNLRVPVHAGSIFVGSRFYPGLAGAFFKKDLSPFKNQIADAWEWAPELEHKRLLERLKPGIDYFQALDELLIEYLKALETKPDELVIDIVNMIIEARGRVKIAELVKKAPLSERPLQKRFRRQTGLTMKEFAKVQRLRTTVIDTFLQKKDQFEALLDAGYFDQAHFINDFSATAGVSPTAFYHYIQQIDHTTGQ